MQITLLKSHLTHTGGAEKYTWRLAHAFKQRGYEVTLLTTGPVPSSDFKIVSCQNAPLSFQTVKRFDRFCSEYVQKHNCPLVFGLDRNGFQTHLRASNGVHAAYLAHRREQEGFLKSLSFSCNPLHHTLLGIEKQSFENKELRALITNSHMVKQDILNYYNVDASKIHVVHNGVEWQEMEFAFNSWQEVRPSLLSTHGLRNDTFHLLFIGHNYRRKGLEPLLNGLSLLPSNCPIHLSVLGRDKELPFFKKLVTRLNLEDKVTFFGQTSQIHSFLQLADALAIPSFYDPFANVTVEALAMGVQVISSRTNGGSEILNSSNGILIDDLTQPETIRIALEQALARPKTFATAQAIRQSIAHLDFAKQLPHLITTACL